MVVFFQILSSQGDRKNSIIRLVTWSNLDLLPDLEYAPEDGSARHSSPEILNLASRLVHVETPARNKQFRIFVSLLC